MVKMYSVDLWKIIKYCEPVKLLSNKFIHRFVEPRKIDSARSKATEMAPDEERFWNGIDDEGEGEEIFRKVETAAGFSSGNDFSISRIEGESNIDI